MALPDRILRDIERARRRMQSAIQAIEREMDLIGQRIEEEQRRDRAFPQTLTTNDRLAIMEKLRRAEDFLDEAANAESAEDARLSILAVEGTVIAASVQITGEQGELAREATLAAIRERDRRRREQRIEAITAIAGMVTAAAGVLGNVSSQIEAVVNTVSEFIRSSGDSNDDAEADDAG